jgi:hypothetical protein
MTARTRSVKLKHPRCSDEPTEIVFCGCYEAFDRYVTKLVAAIGPECSWCTEEQFCQCTGCRPDRLEEWLKEDWVQHSPGRVLRQEDVPAPLPFVLYRIEGDTQRVRVFSAGAWGATAEQPTPLQ